MYFKCVLHSLAQITPFHQLQFQTQIVLPFQKYQTLFTTAKLSTTNLI